MAILKNISKRHRPPGFCRCRAWLFLLLVLSMLPNSPSWGTDFDQNQIRAVYIYNLISFVEWPPQTDDRENKKPFVIAVLGSDTIAHYLKSLVRGERFQGQKLVVKSCSSVTEADGCRIIFIGPDATTNMVQILRKTAGGGPLTVGAADGFISLGGMVNLRYRNRRIKIEINLDAAHKAGIRFNSKLLKIATTIGSKR